MAKSFTELVDIIYFTPENAKFYETQNGFAALEAFIPPVNFDDLDEFAPPTKAEEGKEAGSSGKAGGENKPEKSGDKKGVSEAEGEPDNDKRVAGRTLYKEAAEGEKLECVWQDLGRVFFHRAFPFEKPDEFISILDKENREYGIIRDIADFDEQSREIINKALRRKYFCPEITKIHSLKEQFGYSYWDIDTDSGRIEIALKDTFSSIARISDTFLIISDVSGNRFKISDVSALDRKSFRKLELYL